MKCLLCTLATCLLFTTLTEGQVQYRKYDTLMTIGKTGFRFYCRNRIISQNEVRVKPYGFENSARDLNFYTKGLVYSALVDDLNNDGFPDLVLFIKTDTAGIYGTVYVFASDQNKNIVPIAMPDLMLDGKLDVGYRGHDEFTMMEGTIMRKFPLYKTGDENNNPTGGRRAIQYTIVGNSDSGYKFKVIQSFELKQ
jgi:hypothetical protein